MDYINANWESILAIVTGIIATASAVAAITPNKTDNRILGLIRKLVDLLALNVGKAKNEKK